MGATIEGVERQIAVIASRQQLHKLIDELPENAEIVMLSSVHTMLEGRPYDASRIDIVGVGWPRFNERVLWLFQSAIHYVMGGVGPRA